LVAKLIPDAATLEQAYKRAAGLKRFRAIVGQARAESYVDTVEVPVNLRGRLQAELTRSPEQAWDDAIESLLPPVGIGE
jgi:hypothetical protein